LASADDLLGRPCAAAIVRVDGYLLGPEVEQLTHRSNAGPDADRERPKQHPGVATTHRVPQQRNQPDEGEEANGEQDQRGEFLWPPVALVLEKARVPSSRSFGAVLRGGDAVMSNWSSAVITPAANKETATSQPRTPANLLVSD
jgi:hypothetical protein